MRMHLRHGALITMAWFLWAPWAPAAHAQIPQTSDLVHFIGGPSTVVLGAEHRHAVGTDDSYLHLGVIAWTARVGQSLPVQITLTSRGFPPVLFFEAAPLLDLITATSDEELRTALEWPRGEQVPVTDPPSGSPLVTTRRAAVREQMAVCDLKRLHDVVGLAQCQRRFDVAALVTKPETFSDLLSCVPCFARSPANPAGAVEFLRRHGLLHSVLRSGAGSATALHLAGFVVQMPSSRLGSGTVEIFAAAAQAREERVLAIAVNPEKSFLESDAVKVVISPLTTLGGILLGGVLGFAYFRKQQALQFRYFGRQQKRQFRTFLEQQAYQFKRQEEERFHERKYENFDALLEFFQQKYQTFVSNQRVTVADLRNRLIQEHIYSMLPATVAATLNTICESESDREASMRKLDVLLREAFREFFIGETAR